MLFTLRLCSAIPIKLLIISLNIRINISRGSTYTCVAIVFLLLLREPSTPGGPDTSTEHRADHSTDEEEEGGASTTDNGRCGSSFN